MFQGILNYLLDCCALCPVQQPTILQWILRKEMGIDWNGCALSLLTVLSTQPNIFLIKPKTVST